MRLDSNPSARQGEHRALRRPLCRRNRRDPFYGLIDPSREDWKDIGDGTTAEIQSGLYDRLEIYYAPKICAGLRLRASVFFHFHRKQYSGTNQTVSLVFDLNELTGAMKAKKGAAKGKGCRRR